jgi:outer membrane PBP1 activator LpoA protein
MQHKLKLLPVILTVMLLAACMGGNHAIIVDTTGLPAEQVELIEWKVKYAVALDWQAWQMKSLEANLDAMDPAQAKEIYKEIGPLIGGVEASMQAFRSVVYSKSPDPAEQQQAYEAFLAAKTKLLGAIVRLLD